MPEEASVKEKTYTVQRKQKNGSIYVYERVSVYNKEKQYYEVIKSTLTGKIMPGSNEIIPTRPKKPSGSSRKSCTTIDAQTSTEAGVKATRERYGATALASFIGEESGIDDDIYLGCPEATAKKIIAVARYYLLTDGDPTSHIETWQLMHTTEPYCYPLSEDIVHRLFQEIAANEQISQSFYKQRADHLIDKRVIAYDSTTESTYGENIKRAKYTYNKDNDGLKADKIFIFYSIATREPICFSSIRGDIPDVNVIEKAIKQLDVLGLQGAEIVTDCGFYSEDNLSILLQNSYHFITRVEDDLRWIRPEVDKILDQLESTGNMCGFEPGTYGKTICVMHAFKRVRKKANKSKGLKAGDIQIFNRRIYIHIFCNNNVKIQKNQHLDEDLIRIKDEYLAGERKFTPYAQKIIKNYLIIKEDKKGTITITYNTKKIRERKKYNGILVIVADKERNTFDALYKYRKREWIEDFNEEYKQRADGKKPRVWSDLILDGKRFVQFVTLCYYEWFSKKINEIKGNLGKETGDPEHDKKDNLDREKALKSWLNQKSIKEIFDHFDAVDKIEVATPYAKRMWTTDLIKQDKLFLEKLGVKFK